MLDAVLASVLEDVGELVADPIAHHPRDADAARLRQSLQVRGDVNAVAMNVVTINHDVAEMTPMRKDMRWSSGSAALRSTIARWASTA